MSSSSMRNARKSSLAYVAIALTSMWALPACFFSGSTVGSQSRQHVQQQQRRLRSTAACAAADPVAAVPLEDQRRFLEALKEDLTNQYANGFTFTPLAPDLRFVDPLVATEGRLTYELVWTPTWALMNTFMDADSLRYQLKSIEIVEGDVDPLSSVAHPPKEKVALPRPTAFSVHTVWETYGSGRVNVSAPLGGFSLEQRDFYLSGQDMFRVDDRGRLMLHESAWDQSPVALLAYANPLGHLPFLKQIDLPILKEVLPFFADAIPSRPDEEVEVSDAATGFIPEGTEGVPRAPLPL